MDRCCYNCMFSEEAHGGERVILICSNRWGKQGVWFVVGRDDVCNRFKQTVYVPVLPEGVRAIPLTRGKYALVDEADYPMLIKRPWSATRDAGRQRGKRVASTPSPLRGTPPLQGESLKGERRVRWYALSRDGDRLLTMHRAIMGAGPGEVVDHINHNGLDNRRCNLRLCSPAENARNTRGRRSGSSRYKGVTFDKRTGQWRARIRMDGKVTDLGRHETEIEAARAYNEKARELFGEFACLNEIR